MNSREVILARIRAAQGRGGAPSADERAAVAAYVHTHPPGPRPQSAWEPVARFTDCAFRLSTTVDQVGSSSDVPTAVARYLEQNNLPRHAVCWPEFIELEWEAAYLVWDYFKA